MPCSYVIYKERRLVASDGHGRLTLEEMKTHDDQLRGDPDFNPEFNQLVDGTKISSIEGMADHLRIVAGRSPFSSTSRRAFVANRASIFGVQRMLTTYVELSNTPSNVYVFHDFLSALKWLGIPGTFLTELGIVRGYGPLEEATTVPMSDHETRRSTRVPIKIRVEASGIGEPLTCEGDTVVVNRHGALIATTVALHLGMRVEIHVIPTDKRARAQVVYVNPDSPQHCGVELEKPANIWGISFPPADWKDDGAG